MEHIPQTDLNAAIDRLWARFLPEIRERVAVLETAAAAFAADNLSIPQYEAANAAAHKLAGTLGTFNLTRGTVLARELELMYSRENGPDPTLAQQLISITAELRTIVESRN
jgi:HPt (histidine-containing phosphotransfer) domain-containing protein